MGPPVGRDKGRRFHQKESMARMLGKQQEKSELSGFLVHVRPFSRVADSEDFQVTRGQLSRGTSFRPPPSETQLLELTAPACLRPTLTSLPGSVGAAGCGFTPSL